MTGRMGRNAFSSTRLLSFHFPPKNKVMSSKDNKKSRPGIFFSSFTETISPKTRKNWKIRKRPVGWRMKRSVWMRDVSYCGPYPYISLSEERSVRRPCSVGSLDRRTPLAVWSRRPLLLPTLQPRLRPKREEGTAFQTVLHRRLHRPRLETFVIRCYSFRPPHQNPIACHLIQSNKKCGFKTEFLTMTNCVLTIE